jgi:hypothetical protein
MPKGRPWTAAEIALFGTDTDSAIAERLGSTREAIAVCRSKRGIPAFTHHRGHSRGHTRNGRRHWGTLELAMLRETDSDFELARILCRSISEIANKRRTLKRKK